MRFRYLASSRALSVVVAVVCLAPAIVVGQTTSTGKTRTVATAKTWTQPRTPDGQPDLQGIWSNATTTPLERPVALAGKDVLTDEETANLAKETQRNRNTDRRDGKGTDVDVARAYNEFWWERGNLLNRTSLIVDPADGRLPSLTPKAERRTATLAEARRLRGPADSWEDRPLQERCLLYHGVPPLPTGYNNNYQIVQTTGYVAIIHEMLHEARLIPLDGRPHVGTNLRLWMGDSRGRWEGNTLIVETTNFSSQPNLFRFPASGATVRIVERFTRVDADHIDYRFLVEDPETYTRPWTAVLPMTKIEGPIYEYACHEGNVGMEGILSGHRADEQAAAAASRK